MSPRIAAVFATMNRAATAVACVRSLAAQTRPPGLVVVSDNVSTDATVADLECLTDLPFELRIHRMAENRGNAGGVEEAMAVAAAAGADAFWILDDDSIPRPDALAELARHGLLEDRVFHPLQIDPRTGWITWPVPLKDPDGNWRLVKRMEELPVTGDVWESRPSWTGALIPKVIVERVGPVNGDLFIRGEDDEYAFRIANSGVKYFVVRDAVLDHPGPREQRHLRMFGKNFFWEAGLPEWKMYYQVRNAIWLKKRLVGMPAAVAVTLLYGVVELFSGKCSVARLQTLAQACRDGWSGRLGAREG